MVISQYQKPKKRSENRQKPYPELRLERDEILIYYCDEDDMPFYLSPVCIGKERYRKTLRTILEANGGFQPCSKREGLCAACMVFGMVFPKRRRKSKTQYQYRRILDVRLYLCEARREKYPKNITR